jgi:hypothetical protein
MEISRFFSLFYSCRSLWTQASAGWFAVIAVFVVCRCCSGKALIMPVCIVPYLADKHGKNIFDWTGRGRLYQIPQQVLVKITNCMLWSANYYA